MGAAGDRSLNAGSPHDKGRGDSSGQLQRARPLTMRKGYGDAVAYVYRSRCVSTGGAPGRALRLCSRALPELAPTGTGCKGLEEPR